MSSAGTGTEPLGCFFPTDRPLAAFEPTGTDPVLGYATLSEILQRY